MSSPERYKAFLADGEPSRVFRTITPLPLPQTTSFWGRQWHRLAQAPYFVSRYRSVGEFHDIRRRVWELIEKHKPDLLFTDGLPAAQYTVDFGSLPCVVDAHDAVSLGFRRGAVYARSYLRRFRLLLESLSVRRFEVATALRVDAYLVNSRIDQEVLISYHPAIKVYCVPNGVDAEYFTPADAICDDKTIVFTGVMSYSPNRDAAHFLCKEILPSLRDRIPDVKVQLVGSDPTDDVRDLAGNGVTVTGTVADIRPYIQHATVFVSPLRFGTGAKNKVLAALAMGKAVVATPESCAGLDVTPEKHLLVAENPTDFAGHIVALLTDPGRRRQLGIAGRDLVVERYRWDVMGEQLEGLLESLVFPAESPQRIPEESRYRGRRHARRSVV